MSRGTIAYGVLLAVTVALYFVMVLWSGPMISVQADGLMPFDTRFFGYSEISARAFLSTLTPTGRDFYLHIQHRLDMVFPALLALVMAIGLWWLYAEKSRLMRGLLALLPMAYAVVDYVENARVAVLLQLPVPDAKLIASASQATSLKYILVSASMGLLCVGIIGNWKSR